MNCCNKPRVETYIFLVKQQMFVDQCFNCNKIHRVYTDEEIEKAVATTRGYFNVVKAKDTFNNKEDMV